MSHACGDRPCPLKPEFNTVWGTARYVKAIHDSTTFFVKACDSNQHTPTSIT